MPALLRKLLVFDLDGSDTGALVALDGVRNV